MSSARVLRLLVLAAFAAALLWCVPAALARADGTWKTPERISGSSHVDGFRLAGGAGGDVVATWLVHDGGNYAVQAARRAAGSTTWGGVQTIVTLPSFVMVPQVAVDAHGDALVAWRVNDGGVTSIATSQSLSLIHI